MASEIEEVVAEVRRPRSDVMRGLIELGLSQRRLLPTILASQRPACIPAPKETCLVLVTVHQHRAVWGRARLEGRSRSEAARKLLQRGLGMWEAGGILPPAASPGGTRPLHLRLPLPWLERIDRTAVRCKMSRSATIRHLLEIAASQGAPAGSAPPEVGELVKCGTTLPGELVGQIAAGMGDGSQAAEMRRLVGVGLALLGEGRSDLAPSARPERKLHIRLDPRDLERIRELAEPRNLPVSAVVRWLLDLGISAQGVGDTA